MKRATLLAIIVLLLIGAGGWARGSREAHDGISIVATTGQIGDAVARIAPQADLTVLMGPGSDPHTYFPSTREVQRIQRADLVLWSGLELEIQMTGALQDLSDKALEVGRTVPEHMLQVWEGHHHDDDNHHDHDDHYDDDNHHDHDHGEYDPHIWHDLDIWTIAVEAIAERIAELDPANRDTYRRNAADYVAELRDLKAWATRRFNEVPLQQRVLVTSHDAFGYLARAYGWHARGILGISTEDEAGVRDIQELAHFVTERDVRAIFFETAVDQRASRALQEAVQARGGSVVISQAPLYSDALGEVEPVNTFIGAYRHNVNTIVDTILGNR